MSIITKYLIREITKFFFIVLAVVIAIYLAVDFFERIDKFLEAEVPATLAVWYFLFKVPSIVVQMLPVSLLLSILVTFGIMNKKNELVALRSSGVSIYHLFKSVATLGVLGAVLFFLLAEMVVPAALSHANRIWREDVRGGSTLKTRKNFWITRDRSFFKIGEYDPAGQVMYDITVYDLDKQFHLTKRMDARRGQFEENGWILEDLLVQTIDPATGMPELSAHDRRKTALAITPEDEDLQQAAKKTEEMDYRTLSAKIGKIEAEGDNATRYRVDLHNKMAMPAVCLIMCFIGTGISVRGKRREGLPLVIAYGIGVAFLYYVFLSLCIALGRGGILPPVAAAWAPHLIFLCVGGVTLINAE